MQQPDRQPLLTIWLLLTGSGMVDQDFISGVGQRVLADELRVMVFLFLSPSLFLGDRLGNLHLLQN